jgi:endonuclease/exonuclease/phosphatase family metal-dependent hydrolase
VADVQVFCEVWTPEEVEPGVVIEGKLACDGHGGDLTAPWPLAPELSSFFVAYAVNMPRPRQFKLPSPAGGLPGSWGVRVRTTLPVLGVDLLPLPAERDGARHRRAVCVRVDVGGAPVTVVALHGSAEIPFGPVRQLAALHGRLPEGRVVVTGDLNTWLPVARRLLGNDLRPAVKAPTWPAGLPFAQIDHIFVRGLRPLAGYVGRRYGSDHRPVHATLTVNPE